MNDKGAAAEQAAAEFLRRAGLSIVERNWQCRRGEIDLIAREGETLVFVEVRARASRRFGGAAASIGQAKRAKLLTAAQTYLSSLRVTPPCRFDAVCFEGSEIIWLKNCLDATDA
ncbi:YraN family protein [Chitinilyticum aquatile]|uniref:YraN family protein n=1 Tax=Chitinilyticum aquatile TaxID=362520 RepID=UPI00040354B5|nr:YraN family protein [Chitinilyticum aquatile]